MTTMELVRDRTVLNVRTGELLSLESASDAELADTRAALNELRHAREAAARMVDEELTRRSDRKLALGETSTYSFDAGDYHVSVSGGSTGTYNANALRAELLRLDDQGKLSITREAAINAFHVADYRLDLARWKRLCERFPALRAVGERFVSPRPRSVRVTPRRSQAIEGTAEELTA